MTTCQVHLSNFLVNCLEMLEVYLLIFNFQPAIGHSPSPHADQNPMRARLAGVDVTSSSTTRPNPTPAGVSLSSSGSAGPPPGIISGIQPTTTGPPKTSGTNRQTAHGSKSLRYTDNCFEAGYWDVFPGSCA